MSDIHKLDIRKKNQNDAKMTITVHNKRNLNHPVKKENSLIVGDFQKDSEKNDIVKRRRSFVQKYNQSRRYILKSKPKNYNNSSSKESNNSKKNLKINLKYNLFSDRSKFSKPKIILNPKINYAKEIELKRKNRNNGLLTPNCIKTNQSINFALSDKFERDENEKRDKIDEIEDVLDSSNISYRNCPNYNNYKFRIQNNFIRVLNPKDNQRKDSIPYLNIKNVPLNISSPPSKIIKKNNVVLSKADLKKDNHMEINTEYKRFSYLKQNFSGLNSKNNYVFKMKNPKVEGDVI